MARNLLEINNLIVSFETPQGELTAVKGVSFDVGEGEILALVGESGCGKTVLCKSMLKILCERGRIRQGQILLNGEDLAPVPERDMQAHRGGEIAMIFQDPQASLDPAFPVGKQIEEVVRIHQGLTGAEAKAKAVELMEMVQIPDAAHRYGQRPYQFSGGMRQRIIIAIALAGRPMLLLADEPTTALDEETQQEILKLLQGICQKTGVAVLFITHDLSLVEDVADRVAIMKDGCIVEQGPVSQVFAEPGHSYTKKLLGYLDYKKGRGHQHGKTREQQKNEGREPLLSIKGLNKSFPLHRKKNNLVLQNFNMDICRGEIVGLVGRSGCGKSTLAACIMGFEKPDSGRIFTAPGANVQMIFQDSQSAFNDRMTVTQIIAEPLHVKQTPQQRKWSNRNEIKRAVRQAMQAVELDPEIFADRKAYQLSGGQRQRIAIARALIAEPQLIIADEPLTGLDVTAQAQIVHLLKKLAEERGLAILFIAHDLPMVSHISDRIIHMEFHSEREEEAE